MTVRLSTFIALLAVLAGCQSEAPRAPAEAGDAQDRLTVSEEPTEVVFVCQYGYAKSLVSGRHFERMAAERGIPVRVIARGITPTDSVPGPLAAALSGDGFEVADFRPQALAAAELATAEYVVSFGNEMPESPGASTRDWSDVSALSEDYPTARDEIVAHASELLDEIEADRARTP